MMTVGLKPISQRNILPYFLHISLNLIMGLPPANSKCICPMTGKLSNLEGPGKFFHSHRSCTLLHKGNTTKRIKATNTEDIMPTIEYILKSELFPPYECLPKKLSSENIFWVTGISGLISQCCSFFFLQLSQEKRKPVMCYAAKVRSSETSLAALKVHTVHTVHHIAWGSHGEKPLIHFCSLLYLYAFITSLW